MAFGTRGPDQVRRGRSDWKNALSHLLGTHFTFWCATGVSTWGWQRAHGPQFLRTAVAAGLARVTQRGTKWKSQEGKGEGRTRFLDYMIEVLEASLPTLPPRLAGWRRGRAAGNRRKLTCRPNHGWPMRKPPLKRAPPKTFKRGDRVTWNSEAGRVTGVVQKKITSEIVFKGYRRHASNAEPQYVIKSEKTDHIAIHKGSALKELPMKRTAGRRARSRSRESRS